MYMWDDSIESPTPVCLFVRHLRATFGTATKLLIWAINNNTTKTSSKHQGTSQGGLGKEGYMAMML